MRGLDLAEPLTDLEPVFRAWLDHWAEASKAFPEDEHFYFLEETLSSLLSAASWACKIPSIIETRVSRPSGNGRLDLLLLPRGGPTAVEAKICWFGDPDGPQREMVPALDRATKQLRDLPSGLATRHLALAVGVFERGKAPLEQLLERTKTLETAPLLAWNVVSASSSLFPGFCAIGRLESAA